MNSRASWWALTMAAWIGASATASAAALEVSVERKDGKLTAVSSDLTEGSPLKVAKPFAVQVRCGSGVDCTKLAADIVVGAAVTRRTGDSSGLRVDLPPEDSSLQLLHDSKLVASYSFAKSDATPPPAPPATPEAAVPDAGPTLQELLAYACPVDSLSVPLYDAKKNEAHVVVTPQGRILLGPGEVFDEDDTLVVHVLAAQPLWDKYGFKVRRTSATRVLGTLSILGAGETLPRAALELHAALQVKCEPRAFPLSAFAPGTGKVEISLTKDDKDVPVGDFELLVHRLYDGIFSFGAVSSSRLTQTFGLAPEGDHNVVVQTSEGDREVTYAMFFTPFLWKRRDVEKPTQWWEHVNPTVGIAINDVLDNAFIGASIDYKVFVLTGGVRFQHVDQLASGLEVGDPFAGTADKIPLSKKWDHSGFVAVSIDLRAAVSFLKTLGGS